MLLRTKYLICATVVAIASTALWFIPPVQSELTEEGYIYYNSGWIPVTIVAGFAVVLSLVYAFWQTIRHCRSRTYIHSIPDDSS